MSDPAQNGIWLITGRGWERPTEADFDAEQGKYVLRIDGHTIVEGVRRVYTTDGTTLYVDGIKVEQCPDVPA